jgi:RNA polymerase sigma factor (sigma-70 family)
MPTATKQARARARAPLTPLPSLADADLVRRARDGDDRAFEEIVRRYRAPLIRYSARHVGRDHAEDVTQHALTRAALHLRDDPRPIHLRAWLYRVAHNAAINMRTRKDWGHEELSPDIDGVPQPPELAAQRSEVRQVVSDLDRLPERQRTALLLSVFEGLGYDEIASRLDTSPNSVRALLSRARVQLRKAAAALAPLPLLQSAGRKIWGLAGTAGSEGVAVGGSMVQAKVIAIAATTVVAGAATAGPDADSDRASAAPAPGAAAVASAAAGPDRVVALGLDALITKTQPEPKAAPPADGQPASEAPVEGPPPADPVTEPPVESPPPAEEAPPPEQPADPPADDASKDPAPSGDGSPPADPPPDEYSDPPPDDYGAPAEATLDPKSGSVSR